jgi:flagellar biosynthesis protein FlhG
MKDQASKLRQMVTGLESEASPETVHPIRRGNSRCRVLAVTSGKGGVGKTNVAVNLAIALSRKGLRVLLMDADLGLANVDVILGMIPQYTLMHVLQGLRTLPEIVIEGPERLRLIAAGSGGVQELANLSEIQREKFIQGLSELQNEADVVVIDTGAGLHRNVLAFALAADEAIIVTTPEPTALMDAYGMIKVIHLERKDPLIRLIVNMAGSSAEAEEAGKKLVLLAKRFLNLDIEYAGYIPRDMAMVRAVKEQKPVLMSHLTSPSAQSLLRLAETLWAAGPRPETSETQMGQFFRRVTELFAGRSYGR